MKKILIADASKASLVMTSEVFKDHYPGVQVVVARSSAEALEIAKHHEGLDAFVIDFDLPDFDGAQTAQRLKKLYSIPILITAFDRPEVVQTIETSLKQYADCQSWLKKPVNPEIVIAVAQRFCDNKTRTTQQKRVSCNLPVFAEILLENESLTAYQQILTPKTGKKTLLPELKSTTKKGTKDLKTSKLSKSKIEKENHDIKALPISFCGVIEDCSLSGVKLKPSKNNKPGLTDWKHLLASMEFIALGSVVTLKLPSHTEIENSSLAEMSKVCLTAALKDNQLQKDVVAAKKKTASKVAKKAPALSTLSAKTKKKAASDAAVETKLQSIIGKVSWTSSESGEWCVGVEFENQSLSKKLFEAILSMQLKQQKNITNQSSMKTSRAS
ncbi:response regulator [Spirobacillus cienkowskii]|uniref:Response regulator n=1 Tax=Spirobacillus cienkowskii TaxID=495820 RepID=A0A369KQP5_9BACT|nr:MAG: response regulator [Spirobacillus cienkowskii]